MKTGAKPMAAFLKVPLQRAREESTNGSEFVLQYRSWQQSHIAIANAEMCPQPNISDAFYPFQLIKWKICFHKNCLHVKVSFVSLYRRYPQ
jgi:hypothetical protein